MQPTSSSPRTSLHLHRSLTSVEYFAFGFGSMVGVGWLVLIDDWLGRGGPLGMVLAFLAGGLLLLPVARTYGALVVRLPDAGGEIAYAEGVFPPWLALAAGWAMILAYAIVCPWEAVAIGNLLARAFPGLNALPLYMVGGKIIYAPRLAIGLLLTALIAVINYRGIRPSGVFQDATTFGLLAIFAVFVALGFAGGRAANMQPLFARPGAAGAWLSFVLALQVVPYFMTGFESVTKGSEEAKTGFDPRDFGRAMYLAVMAGACFYMIIVAVVAFVFPWRELVAQNLGAEAAFARAFGSPALVNLIIFAAFLSLLKVFNGNFVAATRLLFAVGRRGLVHPSLAGVHARFGTPSNAIALVAVLTGAAAFLGDAVLVPITEVGSLAAGIGWLSASAAYLARARRGEMREAPPRVRGVALACLAALVAVIIIGMKVVPSVPGSFSEVEWLAFALWSALGFVFWLTREKAGRVGSADGR
ncbi:MAG: APC family permease [Bacteroidales bacterium]